MSNQIVISSGAKVRELEGVLTGTAGVVNALGINVANGIPQLDVNGKILVSQLPNSVMEYKGTWNAATNTPTLANGTGNQGDVYLVSVAGTLNFGAGPITFAVGDQVIYSGTIWQKAGGATGTVTSVAVTESGDALTITGSPITTSGTINIGFTGNSGQYVNGAGGLTTFPSLTGYVPYTGAIANVDLGIYSLDASELFTNGNGIYIKKNLSGIANAVGYVALSSSTYKLNVAEASSGSNVKVFNFDFSKLTDTTLSVNNTRTYTLPNLSGTLALLEGTQIFSGSKTFNATLYGVDSEFSGSVLSPIFTVLNGSFAANLQSTVTANRDIYLPNASGTLALTSDLSSYVPYTGATANVNLGTYTLLATQIKATTSAGLSINANSGTQIANLGAGGGANMTLYGGLSGTSASFSSSVTGNTIVKSGGTSSQFLKADGSVDSSTYLTTSAASSTYLPLIGGILTGGLGGTSASFSGTLGVTGNVSLLGNLGAKFGIIIEKGNTPATLSLNDIYISASSGTTNSLKIQNTNYLSTLNFAQSNQTFTFPEASGTIALTSDLGAYLPLTGGTLTGPLGGTSATFSGALTLNAANNQIRSGNELRFYRADNGIYTQLYDGGGANGFVLDNRNGDGFNFQSAGTSKFRIASTGAATFSSSVTAGGATAIADALLPIQINSGASSQAYFASNNNGTYGLLMGYDNANGYARIRNVANTALTFETNNAEKMRITSGGNIGINFDSPSYPASRNGMTMKAPTANGTEFVMLSSTDTGFLGGCLVRNGADFGVVNRTNGNLIFATNSTERMYITSGGGVLIGKTAEDNTTKGIFFRQASWSAFTNDGDTVVIMSRNTNTGTILEFKYSGTVVGSVSTNGTITSYNITSDYRLKQDLKDYKGLDLISKIKTYDYEWKSDKSRMHGVIAHELQEVLPYSVTGEKDAENMQSVDYSKIVPILVKAIQEQQAQIEELKALIAAK